MKTWKTADARTPDDWVIMTCVKCATEAQCPTYGSPGALVAATIGTDVIFDPVDHIPPADWLPDEIQCRKCGAIYSAS